MIITIHLRSGNEIEGEVDDVTSESLANGRTTDVWFKDGRRVLLSQACIEAITFTKPKLVSKEIKK